MLVSRCSDYKNVTISKDVCLSHRCSDYMNVTISLNASGCLTGVVITRT